MKVDGSSTFDAGALAGDGTFQPIGGAELVVGTHPKDWDLVCRASASVSPVVGALGLHPWFLAGYQDTFLRDLEMRLQKRPDLAVGEIGIDSAWKSCVQHSEAAGTTNKCECTQCIYDLSLVVFCKQFELAAKYNRVCTVHCVRAHGALLELLADFSARKTAPKRINLHSWSASAETTQMLFSRKGKHRWLKERLFFGISAQVNFRSLFRFELDKEQIDISAKKKEEEHQRVWLPVTEANFSLWQLLNSDQVTCSPWKVNAKAWAKFVKLLNTIPLERLLLESDVSASADEVESSKSVQKRWNRIRLAAHVVSEALETKPEAVLNQCRLNLHAFLAK